jgi:hypothetical protein
LEHGRSLELAPDTELGDRRLVELGEIDAAIEKDFPRVGPGLARDHVHHCRLARTIRADHGAQLTPVDDEREVVECAEAVETYAHTVEVEVGVGRRLRGGTDALGRVRLVAHECRCLSHRLPS